MNKMAPTGKDWTRSEIDLIVADYFDMLKLDIARTPYVKAQRNKTLQELTGRSRGSIEYKHQNISAVLFKLGLPWISGYKPMENFQRALIDGIERYLLTQNETDLIPVPNTALTIQDSSILYFDQPPVLNIGDSAEPVSLRRLVRKFDPANRDARNKKLGKLGEEKVMLTEQSRLMAEGRPDLAREVRWISEEVGDGAGYDILSFSKSGDERLLEVKTTTGSQLTPFYLTENERSLSEERPGDFRLVRLYDFARIPKAFKLSPPLEKSVILQPISYRASFNT